MTSPEPAAALQKARTQMMMGVMLVMGACVFGGLTAVVLAAMGHRTPAGIVGGAAGVLVIIGIVIQVIAMRKLKAAAQGQPK